MNYLILEAITDLILAARQSKQPTSMTRLQWVCCICHSQFKGENAVIFGVFISSWQSIIKQRSKEFHAVLLWRVIHAVPDDAVQNSQTKFLPPNARIENNPTFLDRRSLRIFCCVNATWVATGKNLPKKMVSFLFLKPGSFYILLNIHFQKVIRLQLTLLEVSSKNWKVFCTAWHVSSSVLLNAIK